MSSRRSPARRANPTLGAGLVILSSFFYTSYGIWTKLMGHAFGGFTANVIRSAVVLAILVPLMRLFGRSESWQWRRTWPYMLGMTLASLVVAGPFYYAILYAGVGLTLAVNYTGLIL